VIRYGCALALAAGGLQPLAAQSAADSVQAVTLEKLKAVIAAYEPAREIRWYRAGSPFDLDGFYDKSLHWSSRLEIDFTVTHQSTIWLRVYPQSGAGRQSRCVRGLPVHAGIGLPEAAVKEVIKSIPLIDESVGDLTPFIVR
jgi:hypothetical protein